MLDPFNDVDHRIPDALSTWMRLQRRVFALLADAPAPRTVAVESTFRQRYTFDGLAHLRSVPNSRLLPATVAVQVNGYEYADPTGKLWCSRAGLTPDNGAGARLVQSETGDLIARGLVQYGVAVALATVNEAAARKCTVFDLVTADARAAFRGYFGRQSGRWCASLQDPTRRALEAFRLAANLHGDREDFTRGARRWCDGWTQDRLCKAGRVNFDALGIARKWSSEGWIWIGAVFEHDGKTPLIDPYRLMLFTRTSKAIAGDVWRAESAIKDGRSRWRVS